MLNSENSCDENGGYEGKQSRQSLKNPNNELKMPKRSIEVRGATDSGDSDISGISTAIKRRIGGAISFFPAARI